jgi:hypothetical protein
MIRSEEKKISTHRRYSKPQYTHKHLLINPPTHVVWCVWYLTYPYHAYIRHDSFSLHFRWGFIAILSHSSLFHHHHCRHCECTDIVTEIESWMKFMCDSMHVICYLYANNQQKAVRTAIKVIFANWNGANEN